MYFVGISKGLPRYIQKLHLEAYLWCMSTLYKIVKYKDNYKINVREHEYPYKKWRAVGTDVSLSIVYIGSTEH